MASKFELNDSTPAAPGGKVNIKWQSDINGNVSAYVDPPGSGGAVSSVFGRTGAVVAASGDYTAAQITGALADPLTTKGDLIVRGVVTTRLDVGADGQVLTADSTQASGIKWAAPTGGSGSQTPWVQDVNAAGFKLMSAGFVGVNLTAPIQSAAGRGYASIKGASDIGVIELAQGSADALSSPVGQVAFTDTNATLADKRAAVINCILTGPTANARGGTLTLNTRADNSTLAERVRIDHNGNVGIGTSSPQGVLHVHTGTDNNILVRGPVSLSAGISLYSVNDVNSVVRPVQYAASPHYFSDGNVGIGTSSPGGVLEIAHDSGVTPMLKLNQTSGSWGTVAQFNLFRFLSTASAATDGNFKPVHIGPGGIGINMAPPPYGWPDGFYCGSDCMIGASGGLQIPRQANTSYNFLVSQSAGAGFAVGWNKSAGGGETNFYNYGQGAGGGFSFWNYATPGSAYPNSGASQLLYLHAAGPLIQNVILQSSWNDAMLFNGTMSFYINESTNQVVLRVRYSNGTTVKGISFSLT